MNFHTLVLRALVVTEWVVLLLGAAIVYLYDPELPAEVEDYLLAQTTAIPDAVLLVFSVCVLAGAVAGSIGVFRLWRPARGLYTGATVALALSSLLEGAVITFPIDALALRIECYLTGMILGLLWFSEARFAFSDRSLRP